MTTNKQIFDELIRDSEFSVSNDDAFRDIIYKAMDKARQEEAIAFRVWCEEGNYEESKLLYKLFKPF